MSQDDILQSAKTVIQGLDALKNQHNKMLENVLDSINHQNSSQTDVNKYEEKAGLLRKSMDMIELGFKGKKRKENEIYLVLLC